MSGLFNTHQVRRSLYRKGFLDSNYNPTDKAFEAHSLKDEVKIDGLSDDYIKNIVTYRDLFPRRVLPSGKPARCSVIDLKRRFDWFITQYEYDWDTILKATENYVNYYEQEDYKFMQTSAFFIKKADREKIVSSSLSEWCEQVLNPGETNTKRSYDIDI